MESKGGLRCQLGSIKDVVEHVLHQQWQSFDIIEDHVVEFSALPKRDTVG